MLPVRSPVVARQSAGELEAVHLRTGPGSRQPRPRHGTRHRHLHRCHDQLRQTVFDEPAHDSGHRPLTGWVTGADPERSARRPRRPARPRPLRAGGRGDGDHADDFLGGVRAEDARVPAAAAWLAAAANAAGSVWRPACGDPDGDVVPPGWFVHVSHCKRGMRHFRLRRSAGSSTGRDAGVVPRRFGRDRAD